MKKTTKLPGIYLKFLCISIVFVMLWIAYIMFTGNNSGYAFYLVALYILSFYGTNYLLKGNY